MEKTNLKKINSVNFFAKCVVIFTCAIALLFYKRVQREILAKENKYCYKKEEVNAMLFHTFIIGLAVGAITVLILIHLKIIL